MVQINLLKSLPKSKRNVKARNDAKTDKHIKISKQYGKLYFDGPREYGYGGYYYDGRWKPVAIDIIKYYNLKKGDKILDIGCAKGFLVKDLLECGIDAYGLDISEYALLNCEKEVSGRLHLGTATNLPFPNNTFSLVLSINTLHNLNKGKLIKSISEMQRVNKTKKSFIQVDSYYSEEQKNEFEEWVLTAECHGYPSEWLSIFKEAKYDGDWDWTILE